ncbi:MAG: hypothetical protein ACYTJ0_02785 [Planctomycetota bacterium]|jgi:hypothetical protein
MIRTGPNVALLVAMLAALLLTPSAVGQGTSGTFPGPIGSRRLNDYAERLHLGPQQRLAMQALHEQYQREFRLLRDGDIAVLLEQQRSLQGGVPKRARIERYFDQLQRIQAMIEAVDDRFFDRLAPILTDAQRTQLPRLRLARARARYAVQATAARYGRDVPELADVLHELDLPPAELELADPIVAGAERRLTGMMRKQAAATLRMTLDLVEALEQRGFVDVSQEELIADPERLQDLLGVMRTIYAELGAEVASLTADIRRLNMRTCRKVMAVLPPASGRRFRNGFYRRGYPELGPVVAASDRDWMARSALLPDLAAEQHEAIAAASADYQARLDQLLEEGVDRCDEFWDGFSPLELDQSRTEAFRADLRQLQARGSSLLEETVAGLEAQLGGATVEGIRRAALALGEPAGATGVAGSRPEPAAVTGADEEPLWSGDPFLPSRIGRRELAGYAEALALDDQRRAVLSALHADYVEGLRSDPVFEELEQAKQATRPAPDEPEAEAPISESFDHVHDLRRRALATVEAADDALFAELTGIVEPEQADAVRRLRSGRLRQCLTGTANDRFTLGRDRSREAIIDLPAVLRGSTGTDHADGEQWLLADYDDRVIPLMRGRLEAQLDLQRLVDVWTIEIQTARSRGITELVELQQRYRDAIGGVNGRIRSAEAAIVDLNRATLEQAVAEAGKDEAWAARRAYERAAFPSVFEDPAAVGSRLASALELDDLAPEQRDRVRELALTYRPRYEELSRAMVDAIGPGTLQIVGLDPDEFSRWQEHQQAVAKLRYDRNELNASAIAVLRAVLGEDQIRRIGGLPEPEDEEALYLLR